MRRYRCRDDDPGGTGGIVHRSRRGRLRPPAAGARIVGDALADLSFSDLLLLVPTTGSDGDRLVVLGQIRPTTSVTLLRVDLVGQVVTADDWPVAAEAVRTGKVVSGVGRPCRSRRPCLARLPSRPVHERRPDTGEIPAVPDTAQLEYVPVPLDGPAIAVMVRIGSTRGPAPGPVGSSGSTETSINGWPPWWRPASTPSPGRRHHRGRPTGGRRSDPRRHRGSDRRVRSPNAMSALHRMGVSAAVEQPASSPTSASRRRPSTRPWSPARPVIEEVERRPDVIVLAPLHPVADSRHGHRRAGALARRDRPPPARPPSALEGRGHPRGASPGEEQPADHLVAPAAPGPAPRPRARARRPCARPSDGSARSPSSTRSCRASPATRCPSTTSWPPSWRMAEDSVVSDQVSRSGSPATSARSTPAWPPPLAVVLAETPPERGRTRLRGPATADGEERRPDRPARSGHVDLRPRPQPGASHRAGPRRRHRAAGGIRHRGDQEPGPVHRPRPGDGPARRDDHHGEPTAGPW